MNKRQKKKSYKKQEQQIEAISQVLQGLKKAIDDMFDQMKKNPAAARKRILESDLPVESKAHGIALCYIIQANQEDIQG